MVWINNEHFNESVPPGTFGGSMCICKECCDTRSGVKDNYPPIKMPVFNIYFSDGSEEHF